MLTQAQEAEIAPMIPAGAADVVSLGLPVILGTWISTNIALTVGYRQIAVNEGSCRMVTLTGQ